MKNVLIVLAVMASGSAFAIPTFQSIQKQAIDNRLANTAPKPAPTECTSFAGTWTGSCQVGDQKTKEESFVVTQKGCSEVKFGQNTSHINGLVNYNETAATEKGEAYGANVAIVTEWNDKHTDLNTFFVGLVKPVSDGAHLKLEGKSVTRIEGGKLLFDMEAFGMKISCVYDKK